jgi:hypothetical protein
VVCKNDGTTNQIVNYTISGGKAPYQVTIKCDTPQASYTIPQATQGPYSTTIEECTGTVTVNVTDSKPCSNIGTVAATSCCFNKFNCTPLGPTPGSPFNACSASEVTVANKTFDQVFTTNKEACPQQPFSFSYADTVSGTSPCSGFNVTRTYTAVPKNGAGGADNANAKSCIQTWTVTSQTSPSITAGDDKTLECDGTNNPGNRTGEATGAVQCGSNNITQITKSTVDTPTNCAAVKTVTLTLTNTDQCGRTASDDQVFTYVDTEDPVFGTCNTTALELNCASTGITPQADCSGTDKCSGPLTATKSCCFDSTGKKLKRSWTLTDGCGRTAREAQDVVFGGSPTC